MWDRSSCKFLRVNLPNRSCSILVVIDGGNIMATTLSGMHCIDG